MLPLFRSNICGPTQYKIHVTLHPVLSSQSAGSVDLIEILLASHRVTLHDFMALSYGPARALAYDRQRGFRAWVGCDEKNFCLARCNVYKRVQALPTMPLHGASTVDAPH
jgi:methenyltetrahydromethanopterin cyclohydrolase